MIFLRSPFLEVSGFTLSPFLTPAGWHEEKNVYWQVSVGLKCVRMVVESLAHSPFPADLSQQCRMSDDGCRILTRQMSDFYKPDVGCWILTSRMSDFTSRMSDFSRSDGLFLQVGCRMSDFNKSDVGWHL